jgi:hypothetical protein
MLHDAVRWPVTHGRQGQWGAEPFSATSERVAWCSSGPAVVVCGSRGRWRSLSPTAATRGSGDGPLLLAFTAFMVVGALIVAHRPANTIGWLFTAIGLLAMTWEYTQYAYVTGPGALPGAIVAA